MTDQFSSDDPKLQKDLYNLYTLRQKSWLAETKPLRSIVRYHEARDFLVDSRLVVDQTDFLEAGGIQSGAYHEIVQSSPFTHDGEDHQVWRALVSAWFSPRSVNAARPELTSSANDLVDQIVATPACEFMADFAEPYSLSSLCTHIGIPREDLSDLCKWARLLSKGVDDPIAERKQLDDACAVLLDYTSELVRERTRRPTDDLVGKIVATGTTDSSRPPDFASKAIAGLILSGHEPTKSQLGHLIALLGQHPDLWEAAHSGDIDIDRLVEEGLRYRSPHGAVGRLVTSTIEHDGARLEEGEWVIISLSSANRDVRQFRKPGLFDPHANPAGHLAFGYGAHFCVGAALARAQLQEALRVLTDRLLPPEINEATWRPLFSIHGPASLSTMITQRR